MEIDNELNSSVIIYSGALNAADAMRNCRGLVSVYLSMGDWEAPPPVTDERFNPKKKKKSEFTTVVLAARLDSEGVVDATLEAVVSANTLVVGLAQGRTFSEMSNISSPESMLTRKMMGNLSKHVFALLTSPKETGLLASGITCTPSGIVS